MTFNDPISLQRLEPDILAVRADVKPEQPARNKSKRDASTEPPLPFGPEGENAARNGIETAGNSEDIENPHRPKGIKFAILFVCILLGDFVNGYVRSIMTLMEVLTA